MEQDEAARPVDTGAFGANGTVTAPDFGAQPVEQTRGTWGWGVRPDAAHGVAAAGRLVGPMPRSGGGFAAFSGWVSIRRFLGVPLLKSFPLKRATTKRVYEEKRHASCQLQAQNGTTDGSGSASDKRYSLGRTKMPCRRLTGLS